MAFQFVPNADGEFEEGMRQTNPETGVEYAFVDGAWRPLGPKIEDQYDNLDDRYLRLSGGTLTNRLFFERTPANGVNMVISPNSGDVNTSIYALNGGILRFRSSQSENLNSYNTHMVYGRNPDTGNLQTNIYHLADPQEETHAANKRYVDQAVADVDLDGYLPTAGGTLTGSLTIKKNGAYYAICKADDTQQFKINTNSSDYFTNIYAYNSGGMRFRSTIGNDTNSPGYGTHIVTKVETHTVGGTDYEYLTEVNYLRTPTSKAHGANKQYVDDHRAICRSGTSTTPSLSTGMLYYNTSTKQLFIGE